jgi:hypothetical protein
VNGGWNCGTCCANHSASASRSTPAGARVATCATSP